MQEELINGYRKRYEKELENLYRILNSMESSAALEAADVAKGTSTGVNYAYFLNQMRVTDDSIKKLENVLQNPEELLRKGREDDLKAKEIIMKNYDEKKEKYDRNSLLQRLKNRLKGLTFSPSESVNFEDSNERSR